MQTIPEMMAVAATGIPALHDAAADAGWRLVAERDSGRAVALLNARPFDLIVLPGPALVTCIRAGGASFGAPIVVCGDAAGVPPAVDEQIATSCRDDRWRALLDRWRPATEHAALDRLDAAFDPADLAPLHGALRSQLADALEAGAVDPATAHRIAGAAGTLGFPAVSAGWRRLADGDDSARGAARYEARRAIAVIARRDFARRNNAID